MKKILLTICILLFPSSIFASYSDIDSTIKNAYSRIYYKIFMNNKSDKGVRVLYSLRNTLDEFLKGSAVSYKNSKVLSDLQQLNNEKIFVLEQEKIEQNTKSILSQNPHIFKFKNIVYNDDLVFNENGVWYFYDFKRYYNTESVLDVNDRFVKHNGLDYDTSVIFYKDGKLSFLKQYQKYRLIQDDIIYGVPNKKYILELLIKYFKRSKQVQNLDANFVNIKNKAREITKGIYNYDDKIEKIYNYIIKNIDYDTDYKFENADTFSGVKTFKNKTGVCEGYVELAIFMLAFINIDSSLIGGDVIDAIDFGNVGHAWLKVGNYYYDPTFDDPVLLEKPREKKDYLYYKLPRDLFYVNRFDQGTTPKGLDKTDMTYRKKIVRKNLSTLYSIYKNNNYNILNEIHFRKKHNIDIFKKITIEDFIKILGTVYKLDANKGTVIINGKIKNYKSFNYFKIKQDDKFLEHFLKINNYNLSGFKLLQITKDGNTFYALSKDLKLR